MTRAVAVNVGANTNEPGFRGPIFPDGRFEYVPIPEAEPTRRPVPTYGDLDLDTDVSAVADVPVHLDPEFATYPRCSAYTYGDPFPVKAGPISDLEPGDWLLFYATLSTVEGGADAPDRADWIAPDWGAYLIGEFRIERVVTPDLDGGSAGEPGGDADPGRSLSAEDRERFASNAHLQRERFDARVLVAGDPTASRLYDRAVPLSAPSGGVDANRVVTDLSADSGAGPWWRRPLRFDADATASLRRLLEGRDDLGIPGPDVAPRG
ncbi:MAG: hypothetical protein ABEJ74_07620 [Haloferacaceae archaeon]